MIELVPMAYRVTGELHTKLVEGEMRAVDGEGDNKDRDGGEGGEKMDEDEEKDAVFYRLEGLGYRVGQGLVER